VDIVLLIKSIVGLVVILSILLFLFFYSPKSKVPLKKKPHSEPLPQRKKFDWDTILKIIKNKKSSAQELAEAVDLLLKYHGTIPKKLGLRAHPEFDLYSEIILRLCRHPNTNKNLVLKLDRELEKKNPEYNREINDALTKGLNSRGV